MSDPTNEVVASNSKATTEPPAKQSAASQQKDSSETRPGEIKWDEKNAAEAPIPDGIPVCEHVAAKGGNRSSRMFVFERDTPDDGNKVMDFYREPLPESGFQIESEEAYGAIEASKGKQKLSVWIGSPPDKPTNILVRLYFN